MIIVVITAVIVWLQYRHTGRRSFAVVTGRGYQPRRIRLGRWRPLALSVVALYALLSVVLPIGQLIVSSLMPVFGRYALDAFTVRNYQMMLDDPIFLRTLGNTFVLAIGGGLLCMVLSTLVAYVVVRTRFRFRAAIDFIAWMPWAIPGLVLSLAMLWAYVRVPGPLGYGTLGVLVLASVTMGLPLGVQAVAATLRQLSPELEEAARVHRGSWLQAFGRIVFPLIRPSFIAGWFLLIFTFSRELAAVVLLYTPGTETLSIFILSHWAAGRGGVVAATAVVLIATLFALVLLEQVVLRALGADRRRRDAPAVGPPALAVTEAS
jgi:iron(III) transport system permease protein